MNRKLLGVSALVLSVFILMGAGCIEMIGMEYKDAPADDDVISAEEKEFNNSGRAKAIEDETDMWKFHEIDGADFSIKHPHDVRFGEEQGESPYRLEITAEPVEGLEGTMGYNEETAMGNIDLLSKGQYGEGVDFSLKISEKVRSLGDINAQDFLVLGRFEICDVTFERKLYFFNNEHQVVITLYGEDDQLMTDAPEYFTTNEANCGEEMIWDMDKHDEFYQMLAGGHGEEVVQRWYDLFDKIVGTIEFTISETTASLDGKWVSIDDDRSMIEFADDVRIDYYDGEKMFEGSYELEDGHLSVEDGDDMMEYTVVELTDESLVLTYLARGNTLEYTRAE